MFVGGLNFALLYAVMVQRSLSAAPSSDQRVPVCTSGRRCAALTFAIAVVTVDRPGPTGHRKRGCAHAAFQVVSIVTTTGFGYRRLHALGAAGVRC